MEQRYPLIVKISFVLLALILVINFLILGRAFLYPIAIAFLLGYLILPISSFLEKKGLPRIPSILISIIIGLAIFIAAVFFIMNRMGVFLDDMPTLKNKALRNIDLLETSVGDFIGVTSQKLDRLLKKAVSSLFDTSSDFFKNAFNATTGTIVRLGLLPVYIFMFLYYRTKFAVFILKLVKPDKKIVALKILKQIAKLTTRYMGGVFSVVFILCFLNSIGLMIIGMKYAIILGIISALFNFIPYFGTLIGGFFPFLIALLTEDSPVFAVRVVILFIIIQFIENNILTPNIVGGNVKLNPFMIILSIVAGGMIWGLPGMFVVVPFVAILKIIFEHIDFLKPYAFLLADEGASRHAITWKKVKRFLGRK